MGKRALITGSSSGIGLGIAEALGARGCDLVLHGIEPEPQLEAQAKALQREYDVRVVGVSADLRQVAGVQALVDKTNAALGGLDILVNNAGIQFVAPIEDFPLAQWQALLDIHLSAPFQLSQKFLPKMHESGWGRIVNIASVHGLVASAHKAAYVAAKHGLVGLTKVIALETAGKGITCNAICPGWVRTPLVEAQIEARAMREGISVDLAAEALLGEKQPSREFVSVEQLGSLVGYLCEDSASTMTGSILTIDGAWTAQ